MVITLYGIKNCDTVRKAKRWLQERDIPAEIHDFRDDGLDRKLLLEWLAEGDASALVNRRSTTWKQLSKSQREQIQQSLACAKPHLDETLAELLLSNPALIKRPVVHLQGHAPIIGFSEVQYSALQEQIAKR